jgi:hypothetical protein
MKLFVFFGLIICSVLLITTPSCMNDNSRNGQDFSEYFFPMDSLQPYVLAFRNTKNDLDEKFFRLYSMKESNQDYFYIERYNHNLRITEGFKLEKDGSMRIIDHMIVDADGLKRQARLSEFYYFPSPAAFPSRYVTDFPYLNDSIVMVLESKKVVVKTDTSVHVLGKDYPAIFVVDTIISRLVNPETKEVLEGKDWVHQIYAKNIGLVRYGSKDGSLVYELTNIFDDAWWYEFGMAPQVKF